MTSRVRALFAARPWVWSYVLALALWVAILVLSRGNGGSAVMTAALQFASFYVIVGIGQMIVIAAGPGNVDLSFPGVIALAGYLSMGVMAGADSMLLPGIAVGIGVGILAGLANALVIRVLQIPPMIGTLAIGFILQSMAIARSAEGAAPPAPVLMDFVSDRLFGIPLVALVFFAAVVGVVFLFRRTLFGRSVLAIGQSLPAARLAGMPVGRTIALVYVISGALAGLTATLLAAFSGGASLEMGADFTLTSIAVVVIGGTAISGGRVAPLGLWGAAVLLQLLATMLNVLQVSSGTRVMLTGLIILVVLSFTTDRRSGQS